MKQARAIALLTLLWPSSGQAVPAAIVYSGRLTQTGTSQSVADGNYSLVFFLREGNATGTVVFQESFLQESLEAVEIVQGGFQVVLSENELWNQSEPYILDINDAFVLYDTLFLAVQVNNDLLGPPQRLSAVPWAVRARNDCTVRFDLTEDDDFNITVDGNVTWWPDQETQFDLMARGWICWNATNTYAQISPRTSGVPLLQRYEYWGDANKTCGRINWIMENGASHGPMILVHDYFGRYYGLRHLKGEQKTWHGFWNTGPGDGSGAGGASTGGGVLSGRWTLWTCD